jgi:hypothetical protein
MVPQLTRYLYFRDECFYSLVFSLIKKNSFEEVVFWAGEIYYSGFHELLWEHIWKMYYDFYAIKYPKYEKKINRLSKEVSKEAEFKNIVYILNLFYYSKPLVTVFAFRIANPQSPTHVYMGRTPKWLKKLDLEKSERRLIRSIHHGRKVNVAFYLNQEPDTQKSYNAIKKYFTYKGFTLKSKSLDKINYKNKSHILLALVCHMSLDASDVETRAIYKKLDESLLAKQTHINDCVEPLFKTLDEKRLYQISPLIGAFKLERFGIEKLDYKDILRRHWDYFAYNTPLWKERIDNCNGTLDKDKFELIFKNDNDNDEFYEKYNYEPDEQSQETQEKSICKINKEDGMRWLNSINDDMGIKKEMNQPIY